MSTRSVTKFFYGDTNENPEAIIYRHMDGYVEGAGVDLVAFLDETGELRDSRHSDPSYLAGRYLVFLARGYGSTNGSLDFISCGVVREVPGDVEYIYHVHCGSHPVLECFEACDGEMDTTEGDEVEIPDNTYYG